MVRSLAKILLVVSILLTVVPSTQAAAAQAEAPAARGGALALVSWGFLADLWDWVATAWGDNGCILDPSGGDPAAWNDNGCILDPNGGCRG